MIAPYQNSVEVDKMASFKDQLAMAITQAATKGVSVLCDGEDITLYPEGNQ